MNGANWPGQPLLMDGGTGRELRFRGVEISNTIWSAGVLIVTPEEMRQVHLDFISAGATVVGGCCGTRPSHIARLRQLLDRRHSLYR